MFNTGVKIKLFKYHANCKMERHSFKMKPEKLQQLTDRLVSLLVCYVIYAAAAENTILEESVLIMAIKCL